MKRKRRTPPTSDQLTILGKKYAEVLRERAAVLRSEFMLSRKGREQIADDLEALAQIAEMRPECFKGVK